MTRKMAVAIAIVAASAAASVYLLAIAYSLITIGPRAIQPEDVVVTFRATCLAHADRPAGIGGAAEALGGRPVPDEFAEVLVAFHRDRAWSIPSGFPRRFGMVVGQSTDGSCLMIVNYAPLDAVTTLLLGGFPTVELSSGGEGTFRNATYAATLPAETNRAPLQLVLAIGSGWKAESVILRSVPAMLLTPADRASIPFP